MATPPALSREQIEEAALLYNEHEWTVAEIGEHFERDPRTVRRALLGAGVAMRATSPVVLRVKQCTRCLHFLPVGLFSWSGTKENRRIQSWCTDCTNTQRETPLTYQPGPLAAVIKEWTQ